jgi:hypothetical protein
MKNQKVRQLEINTDERVETGAVEFKMMKEGGRVDWPGLFIRGDCAAYLAFQLNSAIEMLEEKDKENKDSGNFMVISELKSIRNLIWGDVIVGGWSNNKNEGQVVS